MTGFKISAWLLSGAFMLLPAATQAQTPTKAQQDAIRSNCRSDFMAKCSSVTPGGREALECLMNNKTSLSSGCQGALNALAAPAPAAAKPEPKAEPAPPAAPQAPAAHAPAGHAPAAAAPHAPEAPKTPHPEAAKPAAPKAAKAPVKPAAPPPAEAAAPPPATAAVPPAVDAAPAVPPRPMRIGEALMIRRFCSTDFKVLCKGVQIGQGRAVQCLTDNREALSPGCKRAMADTGH